MQMMVKSKLKNVNKLTCTLYTACLIMATKKEKTLGNKTTPIPRIIADLSLLFFVDEAIAIPILMFLMDSQDEDQNEPVLALQS